MEMIIIRFDIATLCNCALRKRLKQRPKTWTFCQILR